MMFINVWCDQFDAASRNVVFISNLVIICVHDMFWIATLLTNPSSLSLNFKVELSKESNQQVKIVNLTFIFRSEGMVIVLHISPVFFLQDQRNKTQL